MLENGTEHALDDDGWRWVGDEARLFMKLLGEEIYTQVAMLTSLSRGGDTDDLARSTLNHQQITNADMVAGDGDCIRPSATLDEADALTHAFTNTTWTTFFTHNNLLTIVVIVMMVRVEGVKNAIGSSPKAVTEGVVLPVVVVVTHLGLLAVRWIDGCLGFDSNFSRCGGTTFVFDVVSWLGTSTVVTFGDVDLCFVNLVLMTRRYFDVDLGFGDALVRFLVANVYQEMSVMRGMEKIGKTEKHGKDVTGSTEKNSAKLGSEKGHADVLSNAQR